MVEADYSFLEDNSVTEESCKEVMMELIDEVTLGLCFEVHRSARIGTLFLGDSDPVSEKNHEVITRPGVDVFGQVPTKKQFECVCPHCQRHLAASRFAPHLEKCMGMGRNSSRIASRRIAHNTKRDSDDSAAEDDNDNEWTLVADKKGKKLKKDKGLIVNSPRRSKTGRFISKVEDRKDRKALLLHTCGVISEKTSKMCTRSVRCPQHTDEQRRQVRITLLRSASGTGDAEDIHVDIDSYDDAENQSLRETLQWEASSNSSPADSNSTNNSTGSRKRTRKPSGSKGNKNKKLTKSGSANNLSGNNNSTLYDFS
ncbi:ataxin-7-like protein 3 isoform X4 [Gigantopelta aegis]|uniref:ataxin-7-like protein 3 isoform X3 n=1 Tax=Gigantopelta aegis TaxID=1735272 RepID=UPI001B8885D6|nr:ataxin-7-like protein 3 isoform X3 [Gigantopelta aegis]XP_041371974.1 ataxin-7-like protein 3 isoform X4 [Gigantopelta aegis]